MTPVGSARRKVSPLLRVHTALHPWVAYAILPLFALANAGVNFKGTEFSGGAQFVAFGITLALCLGKPVGVIGTTWLAVRLGKCRLLPACRGAAFARSGCWPE